MKIADSSSTGVCIHLRLLPSLIQSKISSFKSQFKIWTTNLLRKLGRTCKNSKYLNQVVVCWDTQCISFQMRECIISSRNKTLVESILDVSRSSYKKTHRVKECLLKWIASTLRKFPLQNNTFNLATPSFFPKI